MSQSKTILDRNAILPIEHLKSFTFKLGKLLLIGVLFGSFISCSTSKKSGEGEEDLMFGETILDTLVVSSTLNDFDTLPSMYRATRTQTYDIIHMDLDVHFDFDHKLVKGKVDLTIAPYFYPLSKFQLDAIGFDIHKMQGNLLKNYQNNGEQLDIELTREITSNDTIHLYIEYTASPDSNDNGGSMAITSDKGLFFINNTSEDINDPRQIWTQGETQNNSKWFPTFDSPNERFTQSLKITIPDKFQTLSNGRLASSWLNNDGTRTDLWEQDKPHAPYLTMMAIGEYHIEKDSSGSIPMHYYVEKKWAKHAKKIFNHSPEMMQFFQSKLNFPYPWAKYDQVVVKDFVSGAMENTTAVVFGDFIQKTENELIDAPNDYIIAHEMMHHWFGNLVTCEDWSNLTLNEGFANYAEYLWFEHKYGLDEADYHRQNEIIGYLSQTLMQNTHPLIDYHYRDKEDMFDAHSYNKGGLILHMLRKYVGDKAFFAALNKYLVDNAYSAVEVDELRMAFEDVTGKDLHWFFDQWFLKSGHPLLDIIYNYDAKSKSVIIQVNQTQTGSNYPEVFILHPEIAIYNEDGSIKEVPVMIDQREQEIIIENVESKPMAIVFDGNDDLLIFVNETRGENENTYLLQHGKNIKDRILALSSLENLTKEQTLLALKDPFFDIRMTALSRLSSNSILTIDELQDIVLNDKHSYVRYAALLKLIENEEFDPSALVKILVKTEKSYMVLAPSLQILNFLNNDEAQITFKKMMEDDSETMALVLIELLDDSESSIEYVLNAARTMSSNLISDYYMMLTEYIKKLPDNAFERATNEIFTIATNKKVGTQRSHFASLLLINILESGNESKMSIGYQADKYQKLSKLVEQLMQENIDPILINRIKDLKGK